VVSQTIHWDLYLPDAANPSALLEELRAYLWTQSFSYVGQVVHRSGENANYAKLHDTDPDRYPMIVARRLLFTGTDPSGDYRIQDILPLEVYALLSVPVGGCEPAVFAYGRYPASILNELDGQNLATDCGEGWWGHGFCTTRAERPAHDRVLKALDFLRAHNAIAAIRDDTSFGPQIFDSIHALAIAKGD
jgi:hypothetical protein